MGAQPSPSKRGHSSTSSSSSSIAAAASTCGVTRHTALRKASACAARRRRRAGRGVGGRAGGGERGHLLFVAAPLVAAAECERLLLEVFHPQPRPLARRSSLLVGGPLHAAARGRGLGGAAHGCLAPLLDIFERTMGRPRLVVGKDALIGPGGSVRAACARRTLPRLSHSLVIAKRFPLSASFRGHSQWRRRRRGHWSGRLGAPQVGTLCESVREENTRQVGQGDKLLSENRSGRHRRGGGYWHGHGRGVVIVIAEEVVHYHVHGGSARVSPGGRA